MDDRMLWGIFYVPTVMVNNVRSLELFAMKLRVLLCFAGAVSRRAHMPRPQRCAAMRGAADDLPGELSCFDLHIKSQFRVIWMALSLKRVSAHLAALSVSCEILVWLRS